MQVQLAHFMVRQSVVYLS